MQIIYLNLLGLDIYFPNIKCARGDGMKDLMPLSEARGKVKIVRIEGGEEVEKKLKELGIDVGEVVEIERAIHEHYGPLILKVNGRDVAIPRGIAERIDVEGGKSLLEIEGGKVKIERLEKLGKDLKEELSKVGIVEGKEVEVVGHTTERTLKLEVDGEEYELGPGKTSKILVEKEGNLVQAIFLNEGEEGVVNDIIGGRRVSERLGDLKGKKIKLVSVERREEYREEVGINLNVREKLVTIGRGLAEKVWVKKV